MSVKAEKVRDILNEQYDEYGSEVLEILDYGKVKDDPWLIVTFDDGSTIDLTKVYSQNHIGGDGGQMGAWVTIEDGGVEYHVGLTGTYSSWGGDEWSKRFRIGHVRSWTESMFE